MSRLRERHQFAFLRERHQFAFFNLHFYVSAWAKMATKLGNALSPSAQSSVVDQSLVGSGGGIRSSGAKQV